jgi:hypothetical protein
MTENTGDLIVLDYDGVIRTSQQIHLVYLESLVEIYIRPAGQTLNNSYLLKFGLQQLRQLGRQGINHILNHVRRGKHLFAINGILLRCGCPEDTIQAAQDSIKEGLANNIFPQLPEPKIDVASVHALKDLGFRVSLLTIIQSTKFSLPEDLQGVFEQVMIAAAHVFGDNSEENKIMAYRKVYPDENPRVYVADQSYEAGVAKGIGAQYFVQVTGDLPQYLVNEIPSETLTVDTLAHWVQLLRSGGPESFRDLGR